MSEIIKPAPLEDVMVAMDVVDTLRHQQDIAARELDTQARRERMIERLKELYAAQGIDVPEHILLEGIEALEEERFKYQPLAPNWRTRLAHIWVARKRWKKPLGFLTVLGGLFGGVYVATDVLPERQLRAELPAQITATMESISASNAASDIVNEARRAANRGKSALQEGRIEDAQTVLAELQSVEQRLTQAYSVRIVSRAGEKSGVWRVPEINPDARNYYLIVEAIGANNQALSVQVLDEETNQTKQVSSWGIRVNETTFYRVASDKQDDGIIQDNVIGRKAVGQLYPEYSIPTTGGTITRW